MRKTCIRSLFPAMALVFAMGMATGCSGNTSDSAGTSAEGSSAESTSSAAAAGEAKDTLIIATANETPSLTKNEHNEAKRSQEDNPFVQLPAHITTWLEIGPY